MIRQLLFAIVLAALAPSELSAGVRTWTTHSPTLSGGGVVVDSDTGSVYLGAANGIFRSDDHGTTWLPTCSDSGPAALPLAARAGMLYVVANTGSLFGSSDAGVHCAMLGQTVDLTSDAQISLVIDPFDPATLYCNDAQTVETSSVGIAHFQKFSTTTVSRDGGETWARLPPLAFVSALAADPSTPGVLYAATGSGTVGIEPPILYRSADHGATWSRLGTVPDPYVYARSLSVDPRSPSTIYWAGDGAWKSTDGGATFSAMNLAAAVQVVPDPRIPARLYQAAYNQGVFRSDDGGATPVPMSDGLTPGTDQVTSLGIESNSLFLHAVSGNRVFDYLVADPDVLVLGGRDVFSITLSAADSRTGRTGSGAPIPINTLWGYFSIPSITNNPDNPEVFVKLLDGTAQNGSYWFFYGGLTDLEYTLTVTEVSTGKQKAYTKSAGSECGGSDTAAFSP